MSKIINLTPHAVNIYQDGEVVKTYAPSGVVPRVSTSSETIGTIDGFELVETVFGEVENLPPAEADTVYIVSALVRSASERTDLISPDTSPAGAVRDEAGRIVGVKRFTR